MICGFEGRKKVGRGEEGIYIMRVSASINKWEKEEEKEEKRAGARTCEKCELAGL